MKDGLQLQRNNIHCILKIRKMCHGVDGDHCSTEKAHFTVDMAADQCVDYHYSFSPHDAHTYHVYISNITF